MQPNNNCKCECAKSTNVKTATFENYKGWLRVMCNLGFKGTFYLGGSVAMRDVYHLYQDTKECHDLDVLYVLPDNKEERDKNMKMFSCLSATQQCDPNYEIGCNQRADFQLFGLPKSNVWIVIQEPKEHIIFDGIKVESLDVILKEKAKCNRDKDYSDFCVIYQNMLSLFPKSDK